MAVMPPRPGLYRWRRLTQPPSREKPKFHADSVEHWIKKVEQASEFAVSEAFSLKKKLYSQRLCGPVLDLETEEQLQDHDEAYEEAQELLSDWMNSKLKLELATDQEDAAENPAACFVPPQEPPAGIQKYEKFDDLYDYLEQEIESTTAQDFLQHLLLSEVVDSGILKDLRTEDLKEKRKTRDPRIAMELRHKQVKENHLRRQKALELVKQEKALKKSAMSEAQKVLQEENKKKFLKARKEEEEIQKQMVKLRKEIIEKRLLMEEARKMERKRHKLKKLQSLVQVGLPSTLPTLIDSEKERQKKEKETKLQEVLSKIDIANHKCLQRYFSAWYKLILDLKIKVGKARALADWNCQLKALRAWRNYTWSQKLELETQKMESQLRDQNRKKQLAIEFNRRCILHHYFSEWQCWSRTEIEKRELQLKEEETRRKMAKLLELVAREKNPTSGMWNAGETKDTQAQSMNNGEVAEILLLEKEPPAAEVEREKACSPETGKKGNIPPPKPRWAWQVTRKHAALNTQDQLMFDGLRRSSRQHLGTSNPKVIPGWLDPFEHRHAFQQQLINEQRQQLQEQRELILELQGNQNLKTAQEEAEQATATSKALGDLAPKMRETNQLRENQSDDKNTERLRSENHQLAVKNRKNLKVLSSAHPLLKAMEERAIQRAERRRELEAAKKKREEERLAQMKAEEEERQRQEAAEKEAQLEKRREERRLQKMKELEKQKRLEREQQLLSKAKEHYVKMLLKNWGLEPWKRLIVLTQQNTMVAERHRCLELQRKCLLSWLQHTQETLAKKTAQAEEVYSCLVLKRCLRSWIKYKDYASALEENANKFCEASLKKTAFGVWLDMFNKEKHALWEKQKIADQYNYRRITWIAFRAWRQFPTLMKEEREREERLQQLRKRVTEILPDFLI
ncbi:coiled-coil domain-containing protein 191 [Eublepharis macularius]|uniref:Coiled-coil domain-containing protein 191 n=1 Tax=Eublepharis macularius TaxID=481883 RepID=A0AA97KU35_EUBMA|nr:coiled-coil domain-containing protein 191 [Eublepharis macularius]XP_054829517.1 coiled-coil domain-containing protein 191 [Eublepharis macularius]